MKLFRLAQDWAGESDPLVLTGTGLSKKRISLRRRHPDQVVGGLPSPLASPL
jgi:hypothetical protein